MNFWQKMKEEREGEPILCLAPMADVTDSAFRFIISKYSKNNFYKTHPFVIWTEFVSADGLVKAPEEGRKKLLKDLEFEEIERPIVAQFFTSKPEMMERAGKLALDLGFDGVDINMGCPDKSIEKQGAGASLIKNPTLAKEIILATKQGVQNKIPVSVKTRLGYNQDELDTPARHSFAEGESGGWLSTLLSTNPAVITIHARTRKEMSKVPARWERIKDAVRIRDEIQKDARRKTLDTNKENLALSDSRLETFIIGNGDVLDTDDARRKCQETGCDGVMLGRAIFGNPWLFSEHIPTTKEKLEVLMEHISVFDKKLGGIKSFALMKKHFKSYLLGIENIKKLKEDLMQSTDCLSAEKLIANYLKML